MRRWHLSTLLIGINVGLLLLAVTGVAFVAVRLLQQFADEQALARVSQAGINAQQVVDRFQEDMLADAQLLGERPTLRRLLQAEDAPALSAFLSQFQQTSQLDGCVVIRGSQVVAQSGAALPWEAIYATREAGEDRFLYQQTRGAPLTLIAWAAIPTVPGGTVMVARLLDGPFAAQVGAQVGLPVTIVERQTALEAGIYTVLRQQVLATGQPSAGRFREAAVYLAAQPLHSSSGETVGLIETSLSSISIDRSLFHLVQILLGLALSMAALAALASFLVGRRLGRPLSNLTEAAARIGRGDLSTPIATAAGAEIGTLAVTLEEMRGRLLRLTADLRRQQSEAQAIITGIIEGVFTVDRERRIRYINPQALALLGITAGDAIGRFCGDVLNPQGKGGVRPCEEQCPIVHARFRGGVHATEHLRLPNGQRRTVVITSAPPVDAQQVQVLRDETEVEATRRLRDTVLTNISHEFKTPLSAQLASIELILDRLPDLKTDEIGQLVLSLQRGTLRLTHLIDNLLESVRIEAGRDTIRRHPIALDEIIEEALEFTQPLIRQRDQEVLVDLPYPLPTVLGDKTRLVQVFVNLLANASKFAPATSPICIGGQVAPTSVTLWVEDQGPGLPPMAGQSLFGRFIRAPDEEPEQSGMGLGLWIVKSIVERHGGRVDARSNGQGTRMCVTLPREQCDEDTGC